MIFYFEEIFSVQSNNLWGLLIENCTNTIPIPEIIGK